VYFFPKSLESAFIGLTCYVDSHEIKTVLLERVLAQQKFTQAVQKGETAVLSTTVTMNDLKYRDSSMKIYIGNLPAGKTMIAKFKVSIDVPSSLNKYSRFCIPIHMKNLHPGNKAEDSTRNRHFCPIADQMKGSKELRGSMQDHFIHMFGGMTENPVPMGGNMFGGAKMKLQTNFTNMGGPVSSTGHGNAQRMSPEDAENSFGKNVEIMGDNSKESHSWSINVQLNSASLINHWVCPSHKVVTRSDNLNSMTLQLDYAPGEAVPFEDFVLFYQTPHTMAPMLLVGKDITSMFPNEQYAFDLSLDLFPENDVKESDLQKCLANDNYPAMNELPLSVGREIGAAEYVFMLDRSGSMSWGQDGGMITLGVEA
jgi:hypothetical protein